MRFLNTFLTMLAIVAIIVWQTPDDETISKVGAFVLFVALFARTFSGYLDNDK